MSKISWDEVGQRFYKTGVDHGVLYRQVEGAYPAGVPWNGLTAVTVSPEGAEPTDIYADNIKYLSIRSAENYKATIEALYSPPEFDACDGSAELTTGVKVGQQARQPFGFSWRTILGNDTKLNDNGHTIHILYGCTVSPSEKSYQTVNDSPEAMNLSWEVDTLPVPVPNFKPTAYMEIDCTALSAAKLKAVEDALYGTEQAEAYLPLPEALMALVNAATG